MKTSAQVKEDIQVIFDKMREKSTPSLKLRLLDLTQVMRYLSTNPSEEFVRSQLTMTQTKIRKIIEAGPNRDHYKFEEGYKTDMKKYENDEGIGKLRKQQSTLEYILNL